MKEKINILSKGCIVKACDYDDLYKYGKVFNLENFGPTLHVELVHNIYRDLRLYNIYNIETYDEISRYYHREETMHPWIDIPVDVLDLKVGLHTYRIEFANSITGDVYYQYFTYTIQDDCPDKPYIYVDNSACCVRGN